jgi:pimeloyl-ACP methyl ester carboxylesterase
MKAIHGLEAEDILPALQIPVAFIYGDEDWMRMDMDGAVRAKKARDEKGLYTEIYELKECGHHLYMENPEDLIKTIKNELSEITGQTPEPMESHRVTEISQMNIIDAEE